MAVAPGRLQEWCPSPAIHRCSLLGARGPQLLVSGLALLFCAAALAVPPSIDAEPEDQVVGVGSNVTLAVTASGTEPLVYQWYFNTNTALIGEVASSLTLTNVQPIQEGGYSVTVINPEGTVTSRVARIEVRWQTTFSTESGSPLSQDGGNSWGGAWGDYDGDGWLDLVVANYSSILVYHNLAGAGFERITSGELATASSGFRGVAWGDVNNDGALDLFVGNWGGHNELFQNTGRGDFSRWTIGAPVTEGVWSLAGSWGDYDRDGDLDLLVSNYADIGEYLYKNDGEGSLNRFTGTPVTTSAGQSHGGLWVDYDGDGWLDVYVVNENQSPLLARNLVGADFVRVTGGDLVSFASSAVSSAWGDYDNDGDLDVFVANDAGSSNYLFRNAGGGVFAAVAGSPLVENPLMGSHGAAWADVNNDGWLDLFVANYFGPRNFLYLNDGHGGFEEVVDSGVNAWRDGANQGSFADPDQDGDLDLFVSVRDGGNNFFHRNAGSGGHWLEVDCRTWTARSAQGAVVRVLANLYVGPEWQMRAVSGDGGYTAQSVGPVHFGLGAATNVTELRIEWPSGTLQTLTNVTVNQLLTVVEPSSVPVIGRQPACQFLLSPGETLRLGAAVEGEAPLTCYWFRDQTNLVAGGGHADLTLSSAWPSDSGAYTLVVSNALGMVTSRVCQVTVEWPIRFRKVTESVVMGDSGAGQAAWGDYDGDGLPDLVAVTEYNTAIGLYHNTGQGGFTKVTSGDPVEVSISSYGVSWADYDNDGDVDLFVGQNGSNNEFYENKGGGVFDRLTSGPLVNDGGLSVAPAWADYDRNGFLDLFVSNLGGNEFLYRNEGDGAFSRVDGIPPTLAGGDSWAAAWVDYDGDRWLDLFMTHDGGGLQLYRNLGGTGFAAVAEPAFANAPSRAVGSAWGDYDNDGDMDVFVSNWQSFSNLLFENLGNGNFARVQEGPLVQNLQLSSHGCSWADMDNDGDLDLFVPNFDGPRNFLYRNRGDGSFEEITDHVLNEWSDASHGTAWADYDRDGDLDLYVAARRGQNLLLENQAAAGHWLNIRCLTHGGRDDYGARVRVRATIFGKVVWQMRDINGGNGFAGMDYPEAHFGLGDATTAEVVRIEWARGFTDEFYDVPADQFLKLTHNNDRFVARRMVPGAANTVSGANLGATKEPGEPNHDSPGGKSVWWEWRPPVGGPAVVSTAGSDFDTILGVYTGRELISLEVVGTDDEGNGDGTSRVEFEAVAGEAYLIAVDGYFNGATVAEGNVRLSVEVNAWPSAAIVAPVEDAVFDLPGILTVLADADDPYGAVAQVEILADGNLLGRLTEAPYGVDWVHPPAGEHALWAVVTDDRGLSTTSAVVRLTARVPNDAFADHRRVDLLSMPVAGITAGATAEPGEPNPTGSDPAHSVWYSWQAPYDGRAEFTIVGQGFAPVVGVYTSAVAQLPPPVTSLQTVASAVGNPEAALAVSIEAGVLYYIGIDTSGVAEGLFSMNWITLQPPSVELTEPVAGTVLVAPASFACVAKVADPDGYVVRTDFFDTGSPIGSATAKPWQVSRQTSALGLHRLWAVATDNLGFSTTSAPVAIIIRNSENLAPSVEIALPAAGATFEPGQPIELIATAVDPDGGIARVEYRTGGSVLASVTEPPYAWVWRTAPSGSHLLTARAVDLEGMEKVSDPVSVIVERRPPINDGFADRSVLAGTELRVEAHNGGATAEVLEPDHGGYPSSHSLWWTWTAPSRGRLRLSTEGSGFDTVLAVYGGAALADLAVLASDDNGGTNNASMIQLQVASGGAYVIAVDGANGESGEVTLGLSFDASPAVSLTAPADGAEYVQPVDLVLVADAADPEGALVGVEFRSNGETLGQASEPPHRFVMAEVAAGAYSFSAVATDAAGLSTTSGVVRVTVSAAALGQPVFRFSQPTYSVGEGDGFAVLTIQKSANSTAAGINYLTLSGTARAWEAGSGDFQTASGSRVFEEAETTWGLPVSIIDDAAYEGDQSFTVALASPSGGGVLGSPSVATVTIVDNDPPSTAGSLLDIGYPTPTPLDRGVLMVTLNPAMSGSGWRFPWETVWHPGGASATGLVPGDYPVEYRPVAGYLAPAPELARIEGGATTTLTQEYVVTLLPQTGSLRVTVAPGAVASEVNESLRGQWRLQGESIWRDGGSTMGGLPAGDLVLEFKPVLDYRTPSSRTATVVANQVSEVGATYEPAATASGTGPSVLPGFGSLTTELFDGFPYAFSGQIRSDLGWGSGFVVKRRVVLTAAHVVFNDSTMSYTDEAWWFFQRFAGEYEPPPQTPRGWYVFEGYAAQRQADGTPGVSSVSSQNLDVAALYFLENAGRGSFGGYLASDTTPHEWLGSDERKLLVGYPVEGVPAGDVGKMHRVAPARYSFEPVQGGVYRTEMLKSFAGNSGGPLCVLRVDRYYPAAVYLGGRGQTVVRAIDREVVDLINRADLTASTGDNQVGGGAELFGPRTDGSGLVPGRLQVTLGPPEAVTAGAGWRLAATGQTRFVSEPSATYALLPSDYTLEFSPANGWQTPTNRSVTVVADQTTVVDVTYAVDNGTPPVLGNDARVEDGKLALTVTGAAGQTVVIETKATLNDPQWTPVWTNAFTTAGSAGFEEPVSAAGSRFYRARVE